MGGEKKRRKQNGKDTNNNSELVRQDMCVAGDGVSKAQVWLSISQN
jgi:hypothetical protein